MLAHSHVLIKIFYNLLVYCIIFTLLVCFDTIKWKIYLDDVIKILQ